MRDNNKHKPWEKNENEKRAGKKYKSDRAYCVHNEDTLKSMEGGKLFCPECFSTFSDGE